MSDFHERIDCATRGINTLLYVFPLCIILTVIVKVNKEWFVQLNIQ